MRQIPDTTGRRKWGPPTYNNPTYASWAAMIHRCRNPKKYNYGRYGGRGITVCERWMSFTNFLADMGERPDGKTLDRINNDGNYEPGNCRWATRQEQMNNRRFPPKYWKTPKIEEWRFSVNGKRILKIKFP